MLKPMLLASSMLLAIPAFAQEKTAQDNNQTQQTVPAQDQSATRATDDKAPGAQDKSADAATTAQANPAPTEPAAQPTQPAQGVAQTTGAPAAPAEASPAATASAAPSAQPGVQPAAATAAATAPAQATTQEQVAQAVGRDFGSYDKDADGKLNATEFASWMGALRKAAEPSFQPGSAEATTWASQAFTSADTDKNAEVNKQELTVFLTPKQPS